LKDEKAAQIAEWLEKISTKDPLKPWKKPWEIYQSDNGKNLNANLVEEVITKLQGKHFNSVPYHPSTNGQIERPHATIKERISALQYGNNKPWSEVVGEAVFSYNISIHSSTRFKPWVLEKQCEAPETYEKRKKKTKSISEERMIEIYEEVFTNLQIAAKRRAANHNKTVEFEKLEVGGNIFINFLFKN